MAVSRYILNSPGGAPTEVPKPTELAVVIPTFKELGNVEEMLRRLNVVLKGISQPEPIHLLVGDAELARSEAFAALAAAHEELLADLADAAGAGAALDRCRELAMAIDPRLIDFYDASANRAGDFAPLQSVA